MLPTTLVCISSDVPGEYIDNITRQCPSLPNYELWDTVKESARPGYWERLINYCKGHKITTIYCNRLISLGRGSITNMLNLLTILRRDMGIKICILSYEPLSPTDTLIALWLWEKEVKSLAQSASLARARAAGSRVGRPPKAIDGARIRQLAAMGESSRGIAERLGISHTTVLRKLAPAEAPSKQVVKPLPTS